MLPLVFTSFFEQHELHDSEKKFIRYISHEIRTPLNTVFMGLKLMEKEIEDGSLGPLQALRSVYEVQRAAEAALSVLNNMLMLDKVKQGLLVLELSDNDPYAVVWNTVNEFGIQVCMWSCFQSADTV